MVEADVDESVGTDGEEEEEEEEEFKFKFEFEEYGISDPRRALIVALTTLPGRDWRPVGGRLEGTPRAFSSRWDIER